MVPHLTRAQGAYKADKHAIHTHIHTQVRTHEHTQTHTQQARMDAVWTGQTDRHRVMMFTCSVHSQSVDIDKRRVDHRPSVTTVVIGTLDLGLLAPVRPVHHPAYNTTRRKQDWIRHNSYLAGVSDGQSLGSMVFIPGFTTYFSVMCMCVCVCVSVCVCVWVGGWVGVFVGVCVCGCGMLICFVSALGSHEMECNK